MKIEEELVEIVNIIAAKLKEETVHQSGKIEFPLAQGYADVLRAVAEVEKNIPRTRMTRFGFTYVELLALIIYAVGGLFFLWSISRFVSADWHADNFVNILLFWTVIVGIILGSQALPKILRLSR